MKQSVWTSAIIITLFGLTGCLGKNNNAVAEKSMMVIGNLEGAEAFKATLYATVSQKCSSCHGVNQNPKFADGNVETAYTQAKSKVDFGTIGQSAIVNRGSTPGHCPNCGTATGTELQNKIQAWWVAGECVAQGFCSAGGGGTAPNGGGAPLPPGRVATNAIPIPANLNATYQIMSWDVSSVDPVGLAGVRFTVEVQLDANQGYTFRRPALAVPAANTNAVYVRDVLILINGKVANTTYTLVETSVVAPGATLAFGVSPAVRTGPNDQVSISFAELRATQVRPCGALANFAANVRPLMANNCFQCHGGANGTATGKFNMQNATDEQLCLRAKMHTIKANPFASILIQNPLNAVQGHPQVNTNSGAQVNVTGNPNFFNPFVNWINAEPN
jgi:hypothetical protein